MWRPYSHYTPATHLSLYPSFLNTLLFFCDLTSQHFIYDKIQFAFISDKRLLILILLIILSTTVGIQDGSFDAFLWETFTTKPSFDKGEVKKVKNIS